MSSGKQAILDAYRGELERDNRRFAENVAETARIALRVFEVLEVEASGRFGRWLEYNLFQQPEETAQEAFARYRQLREALLEASGVTEAFTQDRIYVIGAEIIYVEYVCRTDSIAMRIRVYGERSDLDFWTGKKGCTVQESQVTTRSVVCPAGAPAGAPS